MNRKGSIQQLFPSVLALILTGVLLGVGVLVLEDFADSARTTVTISAVNDSIGTVDDSAYVSFTVADLKEVVCSSVSCVNATKGGTVNPANYTVSGCSVIYSGGNGAVYNNSIWKCSYTYSFSDNTMATNATDSVYTSLGTFASTWIPIIVVVLASGIVLAVLLGAFSGKRK